jgi:outer membrane lipoprotein-sorting protein
MGGVGASQPLPSCLPFQLIRRFSDGFIHGPFNARPIGQIDMTRRPTLIFRIFSPQTLMAPTSTSLALRSPMLRFLALISLAFIILTFFSMPVLAQRSAQAADRSADQRLDSEGIAAHLAATSSMTADFVQTDRSGKTLSGQLTLKRPGKIRFQYQAGVPILIVGDGKALTFIDYSARQVSRWPIGQSPLGVLLDPSPRLATLLQILPSGDPRIVTAQARDPKRPEFGTLLLAFARDASAPGGLRLQGWIARDAQNNQTQVRLANQRFNIAITDKAFQWRDPRTASPRR